MGATEGEITDGERDALVLAALAGLERATLKGALQATAAPRLPIPTPVANALATLRRHRDPASVIGRPQYRAALPYAVAVVSQECLEAVIDALGDDADDPTRDQLLGALAAVGDEFDDATVRVMLASVAIDEMPASGLCLALLDEDGRYALPGWRGQVAAAPSAGPAARPAPAAGATEAQRAERKARKQREAEERRRRDEAKARAAELVREARKRERAEAAARAAGVPQASAPAPAVPAGPVRRRPVLTPLEADEFDPADPWVGGVVVAWVPFDAVDPEHPDMEGKDRPCVVVAGSSDHLLVRPCYSDGGVKSRDWTSVPVRSWRQAGFDKPTWVAMEAVRVDRPAGAPTGRLDTDDWNSLW
jgi:hypothetical protein